MDNFAIIHALCRTAMSNPTPAVRRQVERMRDSLSESGELKYAQALTEILKNAEREAEPSKIRFSESHELRSELAENKAVMLK